MLAYKIRLFNSNIFWFIFINILECCFSWSSKLSIETSVEVIANVSTKNELPLFRWLSCLGDDDRFYLCLKVLFPTTEEHDVILLNKFEGETTVLEGYLKNESDVKVSVVVNEETHHNNLTVSYISMRLSKIFIT